MGALRQRALAPRGHQKRQLLRRGPIGIGQHGIAADLVAAKVGAKALQPVVRLEGWMRSRSSVRCEASSAFRMTQNGTSAAGTEVPPHTFRLHFGSLGSQYPREELTGASMTSDIFAKLFALTALATLALPGSAQAVEVNIASSNDWTVFDANMMSLGNAQNVCLNAGAPANCPVRTVPPPTLYGYMLPGGWGADLSGIPGAYWIWAPGITGASTGAANKTFTFQTQFYLCGPPTEGTVWVAADNSAEVLINGTSVLTSNDHSRLSTATVPASTIHEGLNIIQVKATNADNPADCGSDRYQCNPAGMVFGAKIKDALPAWPTCNGRNGPVIVGTTQAATCPAGQSGGTDLCVCLSRNFTTWIPVAACHAPQCTSNGRSYNVGQTEQVTCPAPMIGSGSRQCVSEGMWGQPDFRSCVTPPPPPPSCTGLGGRSFAVGQTETLPCPAGQVGYPAQTRTCLAGGNWGATSGRCMTVTCPGCQCGATDTGITALCPAQTSCGPRRINRTLITADWFCDPP